MCCGWRAPGRGASLIARERATSGRACTIPLAGSRLPIEEGCHNVNVSCPWLRRPLQARFRERLNRFACLVDLGGEAVKVYLPNSGRLEELLRPGAAVILERRRNQGKTVHDLLLVQTTRFPDGEPIWVGVDSRMPPRLVAWLLKQGLIRGAGKPPAVRSEPSAGRGRLDLTWRWHGREQLAEAKSVNLVDRMGLARFPDAPTSRGTEHVAQLVGLAATGRGAWLFFVVQREDALAFSPFAECDPQFAEAVARAREAGVQVIALRFAFGPRIIYLGEAQVVLPPPPFPGPWPAWSQYAAPAG